MKIVDTFPRAVRDIENVFIPLADGGRLAARIWLPEDAEASPVPAILEYIPYRKADRMRDRDEPMHRYFAGHGTRRFESTSPARAIRAASSTTSTFLGRSATRARRSSGSRLSPGRRAPSA